MQASECKNCRPAECWAVWMRKRGDKEWDVFVESSPTYELAELTAHMLCAGLPTLPGLVETFVGRVGATPPI